MSEETRPVVLFVINSLAGGGAERIMSRLLGLSERFSASVDIHLALLDQATVAYPVPDWVTIHQLDARSSLWRSVRQLRALVAQLAPAIRVSFLTRANIANGLVGERGQARRIFSERINTSAHLGSGIRAFLVKTLVRWTYPRADRVIAVSRGVGDELVRDFGVEQRRIAVIPNPVDVEAIRRDGAAKLTIALPTFFVAAIGRLMPSKNHASLLRAFAAADLPNCGLVIIGEGPERPALEALARELGIADRVALPGFLANPYAVLARAQAFVLSSNVEGFPNALVEAMALGIPVIATNCPDGPAEILAGQDRTAIHGFFPADAGILVPCDDPPAITQALKMLQDVALRTKVAAGAQQRLQKFAPEAIADRYWAVILNEERPLAPNVGRSATPSSSPGRA